jgi:hypothetical protein
MARVGYDIVGFSEGDFFAGPTELGVLNSDVSMPVLIQLTQPLVCVHTGLYI